MGVLIRIAIYTAIGLVLLAANVWFVRSIVSAFRGADLVIVPFHIIGQKDENGQLATALAYMLQARLRQLETDLDTAQQTLMEAPSSPISGPGASTLSIIPPLWVS